MYRYHHPATCICLSRRLRCNAIKNSPSDIPSQRLVTQNLLIAAIGSEIVKTNVFSIYHCRHDTDRPAIPNQRPGCIPCDLPALATTRIQMLKVALGNRRAVLSTEHTHLKVCDLGTRRRLSTRRFQRIKILVDDIVGVDMLGNIPPRLLVRNQLLRTRKVNAILVTC